MSGLFAVLNILVFVAILGLFYFLGRKHVSFTKRVLIALAAGIVFGFILQLIYGAGSDVLNTTEPWINLVGQGYVLFLKMISYPLIIVSIIYAFIKVSSLGKVAFISILVLVCTAAIAATVGFATANVFHLDASTIVAGQAEEDRGAEMEQKAADQSDTTLPDDILQLIPSNPFYDMTGARNSSTIAVVIFSMFVGVAAAGIKKKHEEEFALFKKITETAYAVVMRMVTLVLRLTPFGVFSMMTVALITTDFNALINMALFVVASYVAILIMYCIHLIIVALFGYSPVTFLKKGVSALIFAFTSRSSMGTLPITIECLTKKMGVEDGIANIAATFGTSIGQNGCAAIYPAMLAVMIAPTVGINPMSLSFFIPLILVITVCSFGVAGVGGGATNAAIMVLTAMNLPVGLAGLLISVEPLIDMARTTLNVDDSMVSALVTAKVTKNEDMTKFNDKELINA